MFIKELFRYGRYAISPSKQATNQFFSEVMSKLLSGKRCLNCPPFINLTHIDEMTKMFNFFFAETSYPPPKCAHVRVPVV